MSHEEDEWRGAGWGHRTDWLTGRLQLQQGSLITPVSQCYWHVTSVIIATQSTHYCIHHYYRTRLITLIPAAALRLGTQCMVVQAGKRFVYVCDRPLFPS